MNSMVVTIDLIVMSPPYSSSLRGKVNLERRIERIKQAGKLENWHMSTSDYSKTFAHGYSLNKENLGNLLYE